MEPPGGLPPDRDRQLVLHQQPNVGIPSSAQNPSILAIPTGSQQTLERLSRPLAFDKMEALVREMQDPEHGVPVRQQKMFLTSIPYAFMGYDLIEWLMDRLSIEESEALNIANQLCLHGYFFPVNDTKTLVVKDDSSLYRFQTPYYWPWQHKAPDNVEYAIYLAKRALRNKQRHGLEDYESDALASFQKNLKGKWDFITMQSEEQVRLAKERKKGDKIVCDSQERAYWRVHRPPPGQFTPLEPCPVPSRDRLGIKPKKKTAEDYQREVDYLEKSLNRTRMKMSQACESLVVYSETFSDYDFFLQPVLPSNPWVTEDLTFWQLNNDLVDVPTEKRVRRWAISIEELVSDPTGLQEFTAFLEKEYSHENIRFWIAVNRLRRSAHSKVAKKVNEIYEEFLKPGAPCEINIDGKTMEVVQKGLKNPSRFTFDAAAEHIYMLLLKKDCYPRFIRSEHYKNLVASGIQPSHKKRFFNFGGVGVKKKSSATTSANPSQPNLGAPSMSGGVPPPGNLSRRRGSDRSLSGSAHELAVIGVKDSASKVPHSHSQSNLSEIPYSESIYRGDMPTQSYGTDIGCRPGPPSETIENACLLKSIHRDIPKPITERLETTHESSAVCPWETNESAESSSAAIQLSVCPWEAEEPPLPQPKLPVVVIPVPPITAPATTVIPPQTAVIDADLVSVAVQTPEKLSSLTNDISDVSERMRRSCGLRQQNTVDSDYATKRLMANISEQRRASMTITPRMSEYDRFSTQFTKVPSPPATSVLGHAEDTAFPPLYTKSASNVDETTPLLTKLSLVEDQNIATANISGTTKTAQTETTATISTTAEAIIATTATIITTATKNETQTPITAKPVFNFRSPESDNREDKENNSNNVQIENVNVDVVTLSCDVSNKTQPDTAKCENLINNNNNCNNNNSINTKNDNTKLSSELELNLNEIKIKSINNKCSTITIHVESPTVDQSSTMDINYTENSGDIKKESIVDVNQCISSEIDDQNDDKIDEESLPPEELSPTTEEYQEGIEFVHNVEGCDYDMDDDGNAEMNIKNVGCVAPAPTPAPSLAPLAEIETDAVDDELELELDCIIDPMPIVEVEETKKKRKKRGSDAKKLEEKATGGSVACSSSGNDGNALDSGGQGKSDETIRNAVCPWEDEDVTASDATFVKTYATLGYL